MERTALSRTGFGEVNPNFLCSTFHRIVDMLANCRSCIVVSGVAERVDERLAEEQRHIRPVLDNATQDRFRAAGSIIAPCGPSRRKPFSSS